MIRAIAFDAVGTLIHPEPPAWDVYAHYGACLGSRLSVEEIRDRFRTAFRRQEELDAAGELRTSEERERQRWHAIVAEVLDDVTHPETCFALLYVHFRRPRAWRVNAEAAAVLPELARRSYRLALASNYDHRLRHVCAGLAELQDIHDLVISSEVGWRKPAAGFFAALSRQLDMPAEQVLVVGDDLVNDYEGARRAGLGAVLYDPAGQALDLGRGRIGNLGELLAVLE